MILTKNMISASHKSPHVQLQLVEVQAGKCPKRPQIARARLLYATTSGLNKRERPRCQLQEACLGESIPDSDEEDLMSPVKKSEPERTQPSKSLEIEEPRSSQPPRPRKIEHNAQVMQRPATAPVKVERHSTPDTGFPLKQNSSQLEQKLPTPPTEPDTPNPNFDSDSHAAVLPSSNGARLPEAEKTIVRMLMDSGAEGIRGFLQRLENSKRETIAMFTDFVMQGDAVPDWLKTKKRTVADRITAANKLLELHASYAPHPYGKGFL